MISLPLLVASIVVVAALVTWASELKYRFGGRPVRLAQECPDFELKNGELEYRINDRGEKIDGCGWW